MQRARALGVAEYGNSEVSAPPKTWALLKSSPSRRLGLEESQLFWKTAVVVVTKTPARRPRFRRHHFSTLRMGQFPRRINRGWCSPYSIHTFFFLCSSTSSNSSPETSRQPQHRQAVASTAAGARATSTFRSTYRQPLKASSSVLSGPCATPR